MIERLQSFQQFVLRGTVKIASEILVGLKAVLQSARLLTVALFAPRQVGPPPEPEPRRRASSRDQQGENDSDEKEKRHGYNLNRTGSKALH